jgi:hypothetical protein
MGAKYTRFLLSVMFVVLLLVVATPAEAAFVRSSCVRHGPSLGNYVNVCVRIDKLNGKLYGYGGLQATGTGASQIRLEITALHIRRYSPYGGSTYSHITATPDKAYGYVNQRTSDGYTPSCNYGYRAVMSYKIYWRSGTVTSATNFFTPSGSQYTEC